LKDHTVTRVLLALSENELKLVEEAMARAGKNLTVHITLK
jgi:hypothetical protein